MRIENGVLTEVYEKDIPENGIFVVPNGVKEIDKCAFFLCNLLKEIYIPDSVKIIGYEAFGMCESLKKIHVHNSITTIGEKAFFMCSSLKEIHIPDCVTTIGTNAFCGCTSLEIVHLPEKLQEIGNSAFYLCRALKEIRIPEGVTSIGKFAFFMCKSLKEFHIPNNVPSINEYTFGECISLIKIHLPKKLQKIRSNAFDSCLSLVEIQIPEDITYISEYSFVNCTNLRSIKWGEHHYTVRCVDGFCMHIKKEKYLRDIKISKCSYFPTTENVYVAEKDGCAAHGKAVRDAVEDLQLKILQSQDLTVHIQRIAAQGYMDANDYRLLTGACREGTSHFLKAHNLTWDDRMPVQDVLKLTEGKYGFERFKEIANQILELT